MTRLRIVSNVIGESISVQDARSIPELKEAADKVYGFLSSSSQRATGHWNDEENLELFEGNLRELTAKYSKLRYRSMGGSIDFPEWTPQTLVNHIMLEELKLKGEKGNLSDSDYIDAIGLGVYEALLDRFIVKPE